MSAVVTVQARSCDVVDNALVKATGDGLSVIVGVSMPLDDCGPASARQTQVTSNVYPPTMLPELSHGPVGAVNSSNLWG